MYTNNDYEKFGIKTSTSCQYCKFQKQDFEHLFINCAEVNSLRDILALRWEGDTMSTKDWLLGTHEGPYMYAKNYIAMELNRYVQITNWKGEKLSLQEFKSNLRGIENVERRIAKKKNKSHLHERKWNTVLWLLN